MLGLLLSLIAAPAHAGAVWTLTMPLGVPQFTHHKPLRGALYGGVQLGAAGVATWSTIEMRQAALSGDIDRELPLRVVSAVAIAGFAATWMVSAIDGSRLHAMEQETNDLGAAPDWRGAAPLVVWVISPDEGLRPPVLNLETLSADPRVWAAYSRDDPPQL